MAELADVGIDRRLVGVEDDRPAQLREQAGAVDGWEASKPATGASPSRSREKQMRRIFCTLLFSVLIGMAIPSMALANGGDGDGDDDADDTVPTASVNPTEVPAGYSAFDPDVVYLGWLESILFLL